MSKGSIILVVLATVLISHGAAGDTLTGCLTEKGKFVQFGVGDAPAKPCSAKQQQVSIPLDGGQPPPANADAPYRFVGFTTGTTNGGAGYIGLYALCQADYGPDAKACTSNEYLRSVNATGPANAAWLLPTVVGGSFNEGGFDYSGVGVETCGGWNRVSGGDFGLSVLGPQGGLGRSACSSVLPVTCCALAE